MILFDPLETGNRIKTAITNSNYSVEQLADKLAVSKQSIYKWMSSDTSKLPSVDHLVSLAAVLNCSVDELLASKDTDKE